MNNFRMARMLRYESPKGLRVHFRLQLKTFTKPRNAYRNGFLPVLLDPGLRQVSKEVKRVKGPSDRAQDSRSARHCTHM